MFFVSKFFVSFTIKPRTKTIFPPPLEFRSLLGGGNWYPSILNWWLGKLESSLVSLIDSTSIFVFFRISLIFMIFLYLWYAVLRLIRPSTADSNFRSFVWCGWFSQKQLLKMLFSELIFQHRHFYFYWLKGFPEDGNFKYLFLNLDLIITYLQSSFVMNGTWFTLTLLNFNRACSSTTDL